VERIPSHEFENGTIAARRRAMVVCAQADRRELDAALARVGYAGEVHDLRRPEVGLVVARGRMGGDGRPFNFGEATVARATVRLETGETGFAYQLGRDLGKARCAAILDALLQSSRREAVESALAPIAARQASERALHERQVAATRVNFFTMVRGEDE
jgi:alpha-D-ribose 1-methylphosphonate 5-triphosphate synthase subunit PhnG